MSEDGTYLGITRSAFPFTSNVTKTSASLTPEVLQAFFRKIEEEMDKPPVPPLCPGCANYGMIPANTPWDQHWEFCFVAEVGRLIEAGKEDEAMKILDKIYGPICRALDLI